MILNVIFQKTGFLFLLNYFQNILTRKLQILSGIEYHQKIDCIDKKINNRLDDVGKQQFEQWSNIQNDYLFSAVQQAFVYGFCISKAIDNEATIAGANNDYEKDGSN